MTASVPRVRGFYAHVRWADGCLAYVSLEAPAAVVVVAVVGGRERGPFPMLHADEEEDEACLSAASARLFENEQGAYAFRPSEPTPSST